MTAAGRGLLLGAYAAYNAQDVDGLLLRVADEVDWPDGVHRLHGKPAVRAFWTEQWTRTRTHDEPLGFRELEDGRIAVPVAQVVRSLDGSVLSRGRFLHVFRIESGLLRRLDIEPSARRGHVAPAG